TVCPGLSVPRCSASLMIANARRSFTDDIGLKASHLTYIVTWSGAMLLMRTMGVLPIVPRMLSWIMISLGFGGVVAGMSHGLSVMRKQPWDPDTSRCRISGILHILP